MYITICEIDDQSKLDAWNRALKAGALGQPRGMGWGGRQEGDSGRGTMYMAKKRRIWKSEGPKQFNSSFKKVIYFNWRLITLQYCDGFCHTLIWISHGCTCVPHPETPPTSLPIPSLWVVPVHRLWVPCFTHRTWTGHLFHSMVTFMTFWTLGESEARHLKPSLIDKEMDSS